MTVYKTVGFRKKVCWPDPNKALLEDKCKTIAATFPIEGVVDYDVEVKEGDTDIYITGLIPSFSRTSSDVGTFNYTANMDRIKSCILPVSLSIPPTSCNL